MHLLKAQLKTCFRNVICTQELSINGEKDFVLWKNESAADCIANLELSGVRECTTAPEEQFFIRPVADTSWMGAELLVQLVLVGAEAHNNLVFHGYVEHFALEIKDLLFRKDRSDSLNGLRESLLRELSGDGDVQLLLILKSHELTLRGDLQS